MVRARSKLSALFVLLLAVLTGCVRAEGSTAPLVAAVPLEASPSKGASFDFCASPPRDAPMHLGNAAWLAFIAANEYTHAKTFGPMLGELGFHNPNLAADLSWGECLGDLRQLRAAQVEREAALRAALGKPELRTLARGLVPTGGTWGSCARPFLEREDLAVDVFPAVAFQKDLVQTVHADRYLQFFTAGAAERDGDRFKDDSTQVVFARHREKPIVVLSFRGTETSQMADVRADLKVWKTELSSRGWPAAWGKAHSGFLAAFESVEPLLMKKLEEVEGKGVKIWVTGHSLGGALATMMTARLLRAIDEGRDFELAGSYTFGSPRVGDKAFAAQFRASAAKHGVQAVRVRNGSDAVTAIPGIVMDYEHVGTLAYLEEGELQIAPKEEPKYEGFSVADHGMSGLGEGGEPKSGYYRRLSALNESGRFPELSRCDAASPAASQ